MNKIILHSVLFNNDQCDILIEDNLFSKIGKELSAHDKENAEIIDCSQFAILPAFYNAHCHAAMTLFRGFADDKPLHEWLTNYIWPMEAKLTPKDVETGSRLAVLEMIKSGTVFFADMYYMREETMKVVEEMGIRANIGVTIADAIMSETSLEDNFKFLEKHIGESERIQLSVMPHAIYTNSEKTFRHCVEIAQKENYFIHTHLSETKKEVDDCIAQHNCTPVELIDHYGALNDKLIAAHCVHFTESDKKMFANAGATAIINTCSNLKLQSGIPNINDLKSHGINIAIGTDGASSNNNLDMQEEMKFAALVANSHAEYDKLSASEILKLATEASAKAYGLSNAGKIQEGCLADCILLNRNDLRLNPNHDIISNWVYGANSNAIDSVICNGTFVMRNRHIDGEEDIVKEAERCAKELIAR
ncbi:MAG: amidohydrolase [Bacteroidales bacterium]|nr:amidohydrolase [Bacteroidales bacterium]